MTRYVLGFMFDGNGGVVLIKKQKPVWQMGLYNGVGGKIESGENSRMAMAREFEEETGVVTDASDWTYYFTMGGPGWACDCFYVVDPIAVKLVKTTTEEEVSVELASDLPDTISNLPWLIPMAWNHYQKKDFVATATYGE
ncbi:MAG: hypothetical protein C5B59_06715 [Bacteroidetes bacterium]|nr:MAG: hypothetical protein C5B59_06715 [Bacteroidota bacterium]